MTGRALRVLLVHPGASWSTADVYDGLKCGLEHHGVEVEEYRLDLRFEASYSAVMALWRTKRKRQPELEMPNQIDVEYHASVGVLEMSMRLRVDVVLVVSGMLLHPDVILMLKEAGRKVVILFTETPYDIEKELGRAGLVDGCWTCERSSLSAFRAVNPHSGYLPHAWHPEKHYVAPQEGLADLPSHDVVFVGSAFAERVEWFNSIDWTGIDLGLYGIWTNLKGMRRLKPQVRLCVRSESIPNYMTAALYRRAKIGLNLYRTSKGFGQHVEKITHAESLSPRAYELAACGAFHLSEYRAEVPEVFGECVPTFKTPAEASDQMRYWLTQPVKRRALAAQLPACVAEMSWIDRAKTVLGDLQTVLGFTGATHNGRLPSTQRRGVPEHDGLRQRHERDQTQSMDDEPSDGQDRSDVIRGREQDVRPGPPGSPGHDLRVLG